MGSTGVEQTLHILQNAATNPPKDVNERRQLYKAARQLLFSVETVHEMTHRIYYGVRRKAPVLSCTNIVNERTIQAIPLQLVNIGLDIRLFKVLASSETKHWTLAESAGRTNCEEDLLRRAS